MPSKSLMETALDIVDTRGTPAIEESIERIIQSGYTPSIITKALAYYAKELFPKVLPIFPALIHLSCELVGGKAEETKPVATAMMLITASGDIHDDIVDRSTVKFGKKTMFGKFGKDVTLLAGDALLMHGMGLVQNSTAVLSVNKRMAICNLITKAMFELTAAEATETCLWKKEQVPLEEYFEVIKQKGSIAELHCQIGAILGDADEKTLEYITRYGRAIGTLSAIKDEFNDVTNFSELNYRFKNEMLPYPIICAFQNPTIKKEVLTLIESQDFSEKDVQTIAKAVFASAEVKQLKRRLRKLGEEELTKNPLLKKDKGGREAASLLQFLAQEL
jgi:geranylgeranyl pyrophosphate synthase